MDVASWLIVGGLMVLCGLAMARLMWIAEGRPPLRKPTPSDTIDGSPSNTAPPGG